jgi:CRP/FNR family transcriptional regulator, cyclic AMP receptor protein
MRKVLYILSQLSDEDVEWLAGAGSRRKVAPGDILITEGTPADALIFVLDGEVSVSVADIGEIARLGVGEILGEMSFVDKSPPSATVTAAVPTQVLAVDRALLAQHLLVSPEFAARFYLAIAMYLSVRMRATVRHFGKGGSESETELNFDMLDTLHIAGARFDRMIKRLLGK